MKKKIVPVLVVLALVVVGVGGYMMGQQSNNTVVETPPTESSTPVAVAPEAKPDAAPEATPVVTTPEPPAEPVETLSPIKAKTGFTLEADIVYAVEDAPMWSDFSTDSTNVGTLLLGDSDVRLGQGYGEAEGWSKFLPTAEIGVVYIENKYLSTEKPVVEEKENADLNEQASDKPSSDSGSGNNSGNNSSGAGGNPPPTNTPDTNVGSTNTGSTTNTSQSQEDFLKDLAAELGAQYTPDGEGGDPDDNIQHAESNTDHDYSGITISP